jgi:hypothetical protein
VRAVSGQVIGWLLVLAATLPFPGSQSLAQELEPRAYRIAPVGMNFVLATYSLSSGNVLTDPTAPVEDLDIDIHMAVVSYMRTLGLFGRSSSITVNLPYGYVTGSGRVQGELITGSRAGTADLRARVVMNLVGGPAMTPQEFAKHERGRTMGVSLTLAAPTGQYDPTRLVNFGTNRWSFKPEIGYSSVKGRWILDAAAGVWFFTDNNDFLGARREQDPIGSFQAHLSYDITQKIWISLDANYFTGGRTTINGDLKDDLQKNSRIGLTLSVPLKPRHSLRFAAATGAFTSFGADFDQILMAYLYRW